MHCNEGGFCSRGVGYVADDIEKCDANRGLIVVFNAIGNLAAEKLCVSMYRDAIDDNGDLRPYVCQNGKMQLNLEKDPFNVDDCTCNAGFTKFSYLSGAFSRTIPVCIPNASAALYSRIYYKS